MHLIQLALLLIMLLGAWTVLKTIVVELNYLVRETLLRSGTNRNSSNRKVSKTVNRSKWKPGLADVAIIIALGLSVFEYQQSGRVSWIHESFSAAEQYLQRAIDWASGDVSGTVDDRPEWNAADVTEFDITGTITRVFDGDTVTLETAQGKKYRVRLFGIDTPERGQPFKQVAQDALAGMVGRKSVGIIIKDKDQYGRSVAILYYAGDNINLKMVCEGNAWWYSHFAPLEFKMARCEKAARAKRLGLWADNNPEPPWEYRRRNR